MFGKKTAAIALFLLLLLPAAALATDKAASADGSVQELERVEVTGSRLAEGIGDVPAPAYVVTSKDIAKSGARNVQEVLNRVPGVDTLYGSSSMTLDESVVMRGLTSEVLLLVDGMPFMGANYGVGATMGSPFDLRTVPLDTVDRIEVVKGANSAIYGSNAAGGVINIITRKGAEKSSGSIKAEFGGKGWFSGSVRGTIVSDDLKVTLGYTRRQEKGEAKIRLADPATDTYDYARDYRGDDYVLNIEKGNWSFLGEAGNYDSEWDYTNPYSGYELDKQKNTYARASLNYADGTNTGRVYYNENKRNVYDSYGEADYKDSTWGATFNRKQTLGIVPLVWGLDWRHENAKYDDMDNPYGNNKPYDMTRSGFAPYVEATLPVGEANIDLGLRYELWNVDEGDDVHELIPRVSINWLSPAGLLWYATAGRHFTMPSFFQMFYADSYGYSLINPDLDPEKGWTYDLGVKAANVKNPWSFGLFYMDIKDKINYEYDAYYVGKYVNVDKYRAWGAEASVKFNFSENWSYTQSLSFMRAENKYGDADYERSGDPRWKASGFLDYQNGPWQAELGLFYYGDRVITNNAKNYDDDDIFTVNASVSWKKNNHTLRLSCVNLFDKEYYLNSQGYVIPERRVIGSWEYEF